MLSRFSVQLVNVECTAKATIEAASVVQSTSTFKDFTDRQIVLETVIRDALPATPIQHNRNPPVETHMTNHPDDHSLSTPEEDKSNCRCSFFHPLPQKDAITPQVLQVDIASYHLPHIRQHQVPPSLDDATRPSAANPPEDSTPCRHRTDPPETLLPMPDVERVDNAITILVLLLIMRPWPPAVGR